MEISNVSFEKMFKLESIDSEISMEEICRASQIPVEVLKLYTYVTSLDFELTDKQREVLRSLKKTLKFRVLEVMGKNGYPMTCGFTPNKIHLDSNYQLIVIADVIGPSFFIWFTERDAREIFSRILKAEIGDVSSWQIFWSCP